MSSPTYLVFDIETVADGELISRIRYPGQGLEAHEAIARYRAELMEKNGTDFIPYTFQLPMSVAICKVAADFHLMQLVTLDEPRFRSHVITHNFWRGWELYECPTWVSFNGRSFDMPVMEQAAFRFGVSVPKWFVMDGPGYNQPRNRYNYKKHFDLQEVFTNHGSTRFNGGLHLAANLIGKPGKMEVQGHMVQDLFDEGRVGEINDYCKCDALDTYFVFLRTMVLMGRLTLEAEQEVVAAAREYLVQQAEPDQGCRLYLEGWGDWPNPWVPPLVPVG